MTWKENVTASEDACVQAGTALAVRKQVEIITCVNVRHSPERQSLYLRLFIKT